MPFRFTHGTINGNLLSRAVAEQYERAFDRFWRGTAPQEPASGVQGSGLGLAIAAQLATACDMQLELSPTASGTGLDAKVKIKIS